MKVISLSPGPTEILFALGAGGLVIGVSSDSNYPNKVKALPKYGSGTDIDLKEIKKILPHYVLTGPGQEKIVPLLQQFTRVIQCCPTTLQEFYDTVSDVGAAVQFNPTPLVESMQTTIAKLALQLPKEKVSVYCESEFNPPTAAGYWVGDLVGLAGGIPFVESGKKDKKTSMAALKKFKPDVIIVAWTGTLDTLRTRTGWDSLVQNVKIIQIEPQLLLRPGPRLVEGYETIMKNLHKKRDAFDDAMDILDEYYEDTQPMDPWKDISDGCCGQGHPDQKHEQGDRTEWLPKLKK